MKRILIKSILLLMGILFLFCDFSFATDLSVRYTYNLSDRITYNRYNIVLVVDASGSMRSTDGSGLRFDAIGKFVALLAHRGNRVGAVVFNDGIVCKQEMTDMDDFPEKKYLIGNIRNISPRGDTNIGRGLQTAVDMLNTDKDPNLPSIVLLLSDGNTDLPTEDEIALSLREKADAVQMMMESDYKVYAISLNADGSANSAELLQIANATSGEFEEVTKAADLDAVFALYYFLIYNAIDYQNVTKTFSSSGEIEGTFEIPPVGVEEVNIVLSSNVTDYSLTSPNRFYPKNEIASFAYIAESYTIIKIIDPIPGKWEYYLKGTPGDSIQINIVYNTNLAARLSIIPSSNNYMMNDNVMAEVWLEESGKNIAREQYQDFQATLTVTDGKGETQIFSMEIVNNGYLALVQDDRKVNTENLARRTAISSFAYDLALTKSGSYTLEAEVAGVGYLLETESIIINVENTPPAFIQNIEKTIKLWPFAKNETEIDLTPAARDEQDAVLRYEVESSAFNNDEYSIDGAILKMTGYSLSKGLFKIRAIDSDGAYCNFEVLIKTVNVTFWGMMLLILAALLALGIVALSTWILLQKRFYGTCYVQQFDNEGNYYEEQSFTKGRGRLKLSTFEIDNIGFRTDKCYFQATGKRHIFLCMNEYVYGDGSIGKKFHIDGDRFGVTIMKDESSAKGIRVKFQSQLPDPYKWTDYSDLRSKI
ncbi:MAG: VWA domain-containing protein [Clostridiales bacterium]|nr:VWA domain-containing protein [Clostridiales bacterium]